MKYIPLKNTLLEGWGKKDGKTYCLTQRPYKNIRDDGSTTWHDNGPFSLRTLCQDPLFEGKYQGILCLLLKLTNDIS